MPIQGPRASGRPGLAGFVLFLVLPLLGLILPSSLAADPLACRSVKLAAPDLAAHDLFGCALAASGGRVAIGSFLHDDRGKDSGSVYVFEPTGSNQYASVKLLAPDGRAGDQLGFSIALSGDTLVAGAPGATAVGVPFAGAAYVFQRFAGGWQTAARLVAGAPARQDELGRAVAVSGDSVAVGAPGDDDRGSAAGAVYLFRRGGDGAFHLEAKVVASDGESGAGFGYSLSLSGDELAVGAPFADGPGESAGAAYVFRRTADGWAEEARLRPATSAARGASFGYSVTIAGDRVAVGAPLAAGGGGPAEGGAVYVFDREATGWRETARLVADDGAAGDQLGISVSQAGDRLLAGARRSDTPLPDSGSAVLFERQGTNWTQVDRLVATDGGAGDEAGIAVALTPALAVLGAYRNDDRDAPDAGAAWLCPPSATPSADLSITKTDHRRSASPGERLSYVMTVANAGPAAVAGARVRDAFPPQVAVLGWSCSASPGSACTPAGSGDIDDRVDLPPLGSVTYTATVRVVAQPPAAIRNSASVESPRGVEDPASNNSATDLTDVVEGPLGRLSVTISQLDPGAQGCVARRGSVTYEVIARNAGPGAVPEVEITHPIPVGLHFASADTPCAVTANNTLVLCPLGTLAPGAERTLLIHLTVPAGYAGPEPIVDQATVSGLPGEPGALATATTCVERRADLEALKDDGIIQVMRGQTVTYSIRVINHGPDGVASALVSDPVPVGLEGVTWACSGMAGASCSASGVGTITDLVSLPAAGEADYTLTGTVASDAAGSVTNTVTVTTPGGITDPNPANNQASDEDPVIVVPPCPPGGAVLSLTKSGPPQATAGSNVAYSVIAANDGDVAISGAAVHDDLPAALGNVAWTCLASPGLTTCTAAGAGDIADTAVDLAPGGTATYTANAVVDPAFAGPLTNCAVVQPPNGCPDPSIGDNAACVTTLVFPANGVAATKTVDPTLTFEGANVVFTVLLLNGGPASQTAAVFTDALPVGLTLSDAIADAGTAMIAADTVTWNGPIPPLGVVTITITAAVDAGTAGQTLCNQGVVQFDGNGDGINDTNAPSDDPAVAGAPDPTCVHVLSSAAIPTLSAAALACLSLLLGAAGALVLRRRRYGLGRGPTTTRRPT